MSSRERIVKLKKKKIHIYHHKNTLKGNNIWMLSNPKVIPK